MGVVSSVASPSGVSSQICTETRQSLNGLTAHSPSGCLASTLPGRYSFLLARGPLSGWYGCLRLYRHDSLDGKNAFSCCQGKNSGTKALLSSLVAGRPVGLGEKKLPSGVGVRYLYQPGKLKGVCHRATEPVCSLQVYRLRRSVPKHGEPVLYYLMDGPTSGLVRVEVHVVLLTFSCRQKTVSNSLVASLRSPTVVAISYNVHTILCVPPI